MLCFPCKTVKTVWNRLFSLKDNRKMWTCVTGCFVNLSKTFCIGLLQSNRVLMSWSNRCERKTVGQIHYSEHKISSRTLASQPQREEWDRDMSASRQTLVLSVCNNIINFHTAVQIPPGVTSWQFSTDIKWNQHWHCCQADADVPGVLLFLSIISFNRLQILFASLFSVLASLKG